MKDHEITIGSWYTNTSGTAIRQVQDIRTVDAAVRSEHPETRDMRDGMTAVVYDQKGGNEDGRRGAIYMRAFLRWAAGPGDPDNFHGDRTRGLVLGMIRRACEAGAPTPSAKWMADQIKVGTSTINRAVDDLTKSGRILVDRTVNSRRFRLPDANAATDWNTPRSGPGLRKRDPKAAVAQTPDEEVREIEPGEVHPEYGVRIRRFSAGYARGITQHEDDLITYRGNLHTANEKASQSRGVGEAVRARQSAARSRAAGA